MNTFNIRNFILIQTIDLICQYWNHRRNPKVTNVLTINNGIEYQQDLMVKYNQFYKGYWMPSEYTINREDLQNFFITYNMNDERSLSAFKDIQSK